MHRYSGVILITPSDTILLQQRDTNPDIANPSKIAIFGGTANDNETPLDCAKREIFEELGLDIPAELFTLFKVYETKNATGLITESHIFILKDIDQERLSLKEGEAIVEKKAEEYLRLANLTPVCRLALTDYLK